MSRHFRRFEMLLPKKFNDGDDVPPSVFEDAIGTLKERFGSVSAETQDIEGYSIHRGEEFNDDLARMYVDVPDTADNLQFFQEFKERLKQQFRQVDIWIATHPVEVL
jgi:hypothetical protein